MTIASEGKKIIFKEDICDKKIKTYITCVQNINISYLIKCSVQTSITKVEANMLWISNKDNTVNRLNISVRLCSRQENFCITVFSLELHDPAMRTDQTC